MLMKGSEMVKCGGIDPFVSRENDLNKENNLIWKSKQQRWK